MSRQSADTLAEFASNPLTHITSDRRVEASLVERLAAGLGFDRLANWIGSVLPVRPRPWVLFYLAILIFDGGVIQAFRMATGRPHIIVDNPLWVTGPIALGVVTFGVVYMYDRYERALREANLVARTSDAVTLERLVPRPLFWGIYLVALVLYAGAVSRMGIDLLVSRGGPVAAFLSWTILFPLLYLPLAADFTATFIAIEFLLPRRLVRGEVTLDFFDPERLGGLRPVGELFKSAYYLVVISVIMYLVSVYGPVLFSRWVSIKAPIPGAFAATGFSIFWGVGILAIGHSMLTLHHYMKKKRRLKLVELQQAHRDTIENPDAIHKAAIADQDEFDTHQFRIDQVTATKEYPATLTMWSHILLSIMLPKVLQLGLSGV